jgi:hypothetical protein
VRNGCTGGRKAALRGRRRRKVCLLGRRRKFILRRGLRKVFFWRRKVGISTRKVGLVVGLVLDGRMGVVVGWVRNGRTGGRKVGLGGRRKVCLLGRRRRKFILGRSLRNVFFWRRKVGISTTKVGIVVGLVIGFALAGGVGVAGRVRNGGTGGRKVSLRRRRIEGGIGMGRKGGLGRRRNNVPLVRGWREREAAARLTKTRVEMTFNCILFFLLL